MVNSETKVEDGSLAKRFGLEDVDSDKVLRLLSIGFIAGIAVGKMEHASIREAKRLVIESIMEKVGVKIPGLENSLTQEQCESIINFFGDNNIQTIFLDLL